MKTKIKKSVRFIFVFLSLPLILATSLWPHDVMALDSNSVSQPYFEIHYGNFNSVGGSLTQYGCYNASSGECGSWSGWSYGVFNITGTGNHNISQVHLRSPNNDTISGVGKEWLAITFQAWSPNAANYNFPLISYNGSTRLVDRVQGRRYYFPVSVINSNNWTSLSSTGSSVGNTTLTVLYHTEDENNTGQVELLSHLYLPNSGGSSTYFNVSQAIFFNDYAEYLNDANLTLEQIKDILQDIKNTIGDNGTTQRLDDARDEAEDAQSQTQTDGSTSQSDANTDGQTLLQAFSSFIGALNVQAGSCNIDMDTGFIDFGEVNLCQLSPPPAFQAISSIVVIGFAVPLSLACARKIIELFRSFQN